jgi:hypothetical protein
MEEVESLITHVRDTPLTLTTIKDVLYKEHPPLPQNSLTSDLERITVPFSSGSMHGLLGSHAPRAMIEVANVILINVFFMLVLQNGFDRTIINTQSVF